MFFVGMEAGGWRLASALGMLQVGRLGVEDLLGLKEEDTWFPKMRIGVLVARDGFPSVV